MLTPKQKKIQQSILTTAHHDYQKGLNNHAFFKVNDHSMGEDLVQDTFMKTWKYLVRGGKVDVMKAFLYHVLNNLIIDQYRKHKTTSLDAILEQGFDLSGGDNEPLIDVLDGKKALLLIKLLPENYQKIIKMRYVQHLTVEEMSLITGKSRNTISVQAHRGLEKLKALYEAQ